MRDCGRNVDERQSGHKMRVAANISYFALFTTSTPCFDNDATRRLLLSRDIFQQWPKQEEIVLRLLFVLCDGCRLYAISSLLITAHSTINTTDSCRTPLHTFITETSRANAKQTLLHNNRLQRATEELNENGDPARNEESSFFY